LEAQPGKPSRAAAPVTAFEPDDQFSGHPSAAFHLNALRRAHIKPACRIAGHLGRRAVPSSQRPRTPGLPCWRCQQTASGRPRPCETQVSRGDLHGQRVGWLHAVQSAERLRAHQAVGQGRQGRHGCGRGSYDDPDAESDLGTYRSTYGAITLILGGDPDRSTGCQAEVTHGLAVARAGHL
jgi:hypothetical protein